MTFQLEKFFIDVFAPTANDVLTVMYDVPHGTIADKPSWLERRAMATDWHGQIKAFSPTIGFQVTPLVSYPATGVWAGELPEFGQCEGEKITLEDVARDSTIIISMPEFSATPSLVAFTKRFGHLRAASMPLVSRSMEATALSADYWEIAKKCSALAAHFDAAIGIDVLFSTGHRCYFDKSDGKPARQDNGRLHPDEPGVRMRNLPSGEVYVVPNEGETSATQGEIPVSYGTETAVFIVSGNRITKVKGDGPLAAQMRQSFRSEKALANIAEVAIGCNDKAVVWGNVLEDEKAGFHWAYGRSEFIGGIVGPSAFSASDKISHRDIVYAKDSQIRCARFDFVLPDGSRNTVIEDGVLRLYGLA
jgi:hypothetical protein